MLAAALILPGLAQAKDALLDYVLRARGGGDGLKALGFDIEDYPNAYDMYRNEVTLPLHTRLTDEDIDYVLTNFTEILSK